jgi:tRNA(Arg) A34 adenosine deaminase TadA
MSAEAFMRLALELAASAGEKGEVPAAFELAMPSVVAMVVAAPLVAS